MTVDDRSARLDRLLRALVDRPALHARFANTLSLLEYVGARKMLKSLPASELSSELLGHVAEEIRHAQLLKRLALALGGEGLDGYGPEALVGGEEGVAYMQVVDRGAERDLGPGKTRLNYLLTTLLVEERAETFYPAWERLLEPLGHSGFVRSIARDERKHLAQVHEEIAAEDPTWSDRMARLRPLEEAAFDRFLSAVEGEIAATAKAA